LVLECHTLVVREPGAAKNDLMAAVLLLAGIAILVTAWNSRRAAAERLPVGWPLAAAGLAVGLAVGTKVTVLAMAAALSLAVVVLAPAGRRWAAAGWWFVPALLGGGYWYLRNIVVAGNPVPEVERLGPIALPHPERLQVGRPDFSIAHYATDTGVWRDYFAPGLHDAFGVLWPLVLGGALVAALLALFWGRDRIVRWVGGIALFGLVAYVFTPLSAAGAEGAPEAFGINIRYVYGALLAGLALLPLPRFLDGGRRQWWLLGGLLLVLLLSDRGDAVLRDPDRFFALALILVAVLIPAGLLLARGRGASRGVVIGGFAALALVVVAVGYPVQRHYLDERFRNEVADESIPGMSFDSAYRWARDVGDARIGLAGTSAGFAQYGFYGTDLSNRVVYLGATGSGGAFNAIPTCRAFRAAVNAADLDYLVTAPFLNFLHPGDPIPSPEARWLRGETAVSPILRSGPVTVWRVRGDLDPAACGPTNAPLREIPDSGTG
jgi:predicted membrane channel-forming protein YqfA (hemolysin III family)